MGRRDLFAYILIAMLGIGGAAMISGLSTTARAVTPFLMWGGLSSVLLAGIGLVVMLFTAPRATAGIAEPHPPQPLSENAAYLILYGMFIVGGLILAILLGWFLLQSRPSSTVTPTKVLPPAFRGPLNLAALRDPKFASADASKFVGDAEMASGTIVDENAERTGERYTITLTTTAMVPQVYLVFDESLLDYSPGDRIYASCRIERADTEALGLTGCKVISAENWVSASAPALPSPPSP